MANENPDSPVSAAIDNATAALDNVRAEAIAVDAEIQKKENEIATANAIAERDIDNIERQASDAQALERLGEMHDLHEQAANRRSELANRVNQLESLLGTLRNRRIEVGATQTAQEARLSDLQKRAEREAERESVSQAQISRAKDLEERLAKLEGERSDLAHRIEQYATVLDAQREATAASGAAELSEAYALQAEDYREEWQRWLKVLVCAAIAAMLGGVGTIILTHPSGDASNGEIVSRVAIEILVLGLLIYAVRVTAHQFRVHRHLETVSEGKASALKTFSRLVAGPGEAEVRTAVAVALAQAVFDSGTTGFIDSTQDGVTLIERIAAPVSQRLAD